MLHIMNNTSFRQPLYEQYMHHIESSRQLFNNILTQTTQQDRTLRMLLTEHLNYNDMQNNTSVRTSRYLNRFNSSFPSNMSSKWVQFRT